MTDVRNGVGEVERRDTPVWSMAKVVQTASVGGRREEVERERSGASSEAEPKRNGTTEPQTEAKRVCGEPRKFRS